MHSKLLLFAVPFLFVALAFIPQTEAEYLIVGNDADWGADTFNDTFTKADSATTAMGALSNGEHVRLTLRSNCCTQEIFISFDFSALPTGSTIIGAELQLREENSRTLNAGNVAVREVESWSPPAEPEYTMTYNTRYTDLNATSEDTTDVNTEDQYYNWTVIHAVQRQWDASNSSVAFNLYRTASGGTIDFYSKEGGDQNTRPKLFIEYLPPAAPPSINNNHTYHGATQSLDGTWLYDTLNANFDANVTANDASLTDVFLEFDNVNNTMTNTTENFWYYNQSAPTIGTHDYRICAVDSEGQSSCSEIQTLNIQAYNLLTNTFTTPVKETEATNYNITYTVTGNASWTYSYFNWNGTNQTFSYHNTSNPTKEFGEDIVIPIIQSNDTSINFGWNISLLLSNGTTITDDTNDNQNIFWAYHSPIIGVNSLYLEGSNATITTNLTTDETTATIAPILYYAHHDQKTALTSSYGNYFNWFTIDNPVANGTTEWFNSSFNVSYNTDWRTLNTSATFLNTQMIAGACNATLSTKAIEIQTFDETNLTSENIDVDATFVVFNGAGSRNYTFDFNNNDTYSICIYPTDQTFNTNATIQYFFNDYPQRTYYLSEAVLSNATQDLDLFSLHTDLADLVTITVRDTSSQLVEGALVKILRFYPSLNEFRTIEIIATDSQGTSPAYVDLYDVFYKFIIEVNGKITFNSDSALLSSENIELLSGGTGTFEYFSYEQGVAQNCNFVNATGVISCTWSDTSGFVTEACLKVTKIGTLRDTVLYEDCTASTAGTIGYTVAEADRDFPVSYEFYGKFNFNPIEEITFAVGLVDISRGQPFEENGLFIAMFMFLSVIGIGLKDARIAIIVSITMTAVVFGLGLVDIGLVSLISIIAAGVLFLWRLKR